MHCWRPRVPTASLVALGRARRRLRSAKCGAHHVHAKIRHAKQLPVEERDDESDWLLLLLLLLKLLVPGASASGGGGSGANLTRGTARRRRSNEAHPHDVHSSSSSSPSSCRSANEVDEEDAARRRLLGSWLIWVDGQEVTTNEAEDEAFVSHISCRPPGFDLQGAGVLHFSFFSFRWHWRGVRPFRFVVCSVAVPACSFHALALLPALAALTKDPFGRRKKRIIFFFFLFVR